MILHFPNESKLARVAQGGWQFSSMNERLKRVKAFRHLIVSRMDAITHAILADIARPAPEVIATDLLPTAGAAKFLEQQATRILKPRTVKSRPLWLSGTRDVISRQPHGLVGLIGTWNYPLFLNAVPLLHALVAGNAVLWKPSERTPRFAELLAGLFHEAGFPQDLLIMLPATREAGPQLAEADLDFLHFTGSEQTGRILARRLGERLIPSVLELSGCDPLFVLADADVKLAARSAWYGATLNRGQTCMAVRKVFVADEVADAFNSELAGLRLQSPDLPVNVRCQATAEEMVHLPASFDAELFIFTFDTLDEAVQLHRQSGYRLTASVFTAEPKLVEAWATRLGVCSVVVNDVIVPTAHPATPFRGAGRSGWGCTQGADGLLAMTVPQVLSIRRGRFRPHIDTALNADAAGTDVTTGLLLLTQSGTLRQRWLGLRKLLRGFRHFGQSKPRS